MGTVSAAALLGGLVDLDVLDDQVAGVKTLGVGVGLSVLEEREEELSALHGPAGLGDTELLAFGVRISIPHVTMPFRSHLIFFLNSSGYSNIRMHPRTWL